MAAGVGDCELGDTLGVAVSAAVTVVDAVTDGVTVATAVTPDGVKLGQRVGVVHAHAQRVAELDRHVQLLNNMAPRVRAAFTRPS